MNVNFVSINVCGHDIYKQGALPVTADAREALRAILVSREAIKPRAAYLQEIALVKQDWEAQLKEEVYRQYPEEAMSQGQVIGLMNEEAQARDTIVAAAGAPPSDLLKLWDASNRRYCHLEFGYSCMGYEIPAALGVRMSQPEGEVIAYLGDGTYLMNPTELVTAMQEGLKVTVVIAENHGFQCIRQLQMGTVGHSFRNEFRTRAESGRLEGEYVPIDFAKNAESLGARAWNVRTPDEVRSALREARSETRSCVIVCEVEKHRYLPRSGVWWDIAAAETKEDGVTAKLREEYEEGRGRHRFYY